MVNWKHDDPGAIEEDLKMCYTCHTNDKYVKELEFKLSHIISLVKQYEIYWSHASKNTTKRFNLAYDFFVNIQKYI